ncbi:MAG: IS630 family transposase [Solirubrobacteraceae bacterium]
MAAPAKQIVVAEDDRAEFERIVRSSTEEVRLVERAQIVLCAAEGHSAQKIARMLGCATVTAQKWRSRYEREGIAGLGDLPRPGKPLVYSSEQRARLIAKACTKPPQPPEGQRQERWTYRELAAEVGMSSSHAHTLLARADVKPHLTDYWMMTDFTQPEFEERLAAICGLYVNPPENVLVVSIDEKTGIQAKAPTKPDIPAAPGKPPRREHEYIRNGTQCLFACLNVKQGDVIGMASKTRNRFDLIRFLDTCEKEIPQLPGQKIIAISDNLSTRGTQEVQQWLAEHPRWSFQFTPTHASWLNQIEIFFSILYKRLLKHGAFTSETDPAEQMLAFIETYNQTAKPFKWTYTGKTPEA